MWICIFRCNTYDFKLGSLIGWLRRRLWQKKLPQIRILIEEIVTVVESGPTLLLTRYAKMVYHPILSRKYSLPLLALTESTYQK